MSSRKFFVGGNWKMNASLELVKQLTGYLNQGQYSSNVGKFKLN